MTDKRRYQRSAADIEYRVERCKVYRQGEIRDLDVKSKKAYYPTCRRGADVGAENNAEALVERKEARAGRLHGAGYKKTGERGAEAVGNRRDKNFPQASPGYLLQAFAHYFQPEQENTKPAQKI